MNMKKMVSCLVAGSMLTMAVSAFAQIPETQVSTIDNAADVAFDGSTGTVYFRVQQRWQQTSAASDQSV